MLKYSGMHKHNDLNLDFELPTVESKKPAMRKMHISDSVCESCQG